MAHEMHISIFKIEAALLDENRKIIIKNHEESCNGCKIWVTIQGGCKVIMKLFSSCFRLLYCVVAAGFVPGP